MKFLILISIVGLVASTHAQTYRIYSSSPSSYLNQNVSLAEAYEQYLTSVDVIKDVLQIVAEPFSVDQSCVKEQLKDLGEEASMDVIAAYVFIGLASGTCIEDKDQYINSFYDLAVKVYKNKDQFIKASSRLY